jgi:hypothetical protein
VGGVEVEILRASWSDALRMTSALVREIEGVLAAVRI